MDTRPGTYLAYMLRLWRGVTGGVSTWRASLEDPATGERRGFADLDQLFGYLAKRTDQSPDEAPSPPAEPGGTSEA